MNHYPTDAELLEKTIEAIDDCELLARVKEDDEFWMTVRESRLLVAEIKRLRERNGSLERVAYAARDYLAARRIHGELPHTDLMVMKEAEWRGKIRSALDALEPKP